MMLKTCTLMRRKGPVPHLLVISSNYNNIRHSKEGSLLQRRSTYHEVKSCCVLPIHLQRLVLCAPPHRSCQLSSSNVSLVITHLAVLIIRLQIWASLPPLCSHQVTLFLPWLKPDSNTKNPCSFRKKTITSCSGECICRTRICWQISRMWPSRTIRIWRRSTTWKTTMSTTWSLR